ncbi:MAG: type II toxin-antitoxin system RelE/ParE family toxin [Bacteroidales bacterium]|nr:type II toxin-antitoxin system RelE/ParE family toxin [Bacteroidales bacterium]
MADFVLSERAKSDLVVIANYTEEKWSEAQAERYIRMLLAECGELANKPLVGRSYDPVRPGLRGAACGKHVIFYRVLSRSKVRIVRVLHEKMDFPRHL